MHAKKMIALINSSDVEFSNQFIDYIDKMTRVTHKSLKTPFI